MFFFFYLFNRGTTLQTLDKMKDVKLVGKQFCSFNVISTRKTEVRQVLKKVSFFVVVGLWSQWADKLTIHSIPCSWIV